MSRRQLDTRDVKVHTRNCIRENRGTIIDILKKIVTRFFVFFVPLPPTELFNMSKRVVWLLDVKWKPVRNKVVVPNNFFLS